MGWAWALHEGYEGIVTVDGNGKDGVEAIPAFLECLDSGFDFVQGSRHLPGGAAIRTPWMRRLGIALVHVPLTRIGAGYPYTDTTNAFRAYSRRLLLDSWVQPFRDVFMKYELLAYMSIRAPRLGFRVTELPVRREYPASGEIPTKISSIRGNWDLLRTLWRAVSGKFDPPPASNAALL
jgi:dolichol-phosphate mannosyltransferase